MVAKFQLGVLAFLGQSVIVFDDAVARSNKGGSMSAEVHSVILDGKQSADEMEHLLEDMVERMQTNRLS